MFTAVTWPRAFVVTLSTAVKVLLYPGDTELVVFVRVVFEWFIVIVAALA